MIFDQHNWRVFCALVNRDLLMIKRRLKSTLLTGSIQLGVAVILFGKLFPTMGLPAQLIAPLFIGQMCMQMFFLGNAMGFRNVYDIKYHQFIEYRLTLPVPKRWLFAAHIVYFMIETMIITAPLITIGIFILAPQFNLQNPVWIAFLLMYLIVLLLYGLMFLSLSYYYDPDWYLANVFPRRLTILIGLSPMFYVWQQAYELSPALGILMLASPLTYASEGMRSSMIGSALFIPWYYCLGMLLLFCGLFTLLLAHGITKRLDPV